MARRKEPVVLNPVDRGKPGSKRHLVVNHRGIALAVHLTAANLYDSNALNDVVDAVKTLKGKRSRPCRRPDKLRADKGYDFDRCRRDLRRRGIVPRIARCGIEPSDMLGCHLWVVERIYRVDQSLPPPHHPLRAPRQLLPRLPYPCSRHHLLQNAQTMVVLGTLTLQRRSGLRAMRNRRNHFGGLRRVRSQRLVLGPYGARLYSHD